jgi:hypothetical protein
VTYQLLFAHLRPYSSAGHTVNFPIRIRPSGAKPFAERAILDTGAGISRFDKSILAKLGVTDITSGKPMKLRMADNKEYDGYVHQVDIEFLGRALRIPAVFCAEWDAVDNLLGMEGFFQQMLAAFDHARRHFYFSA